MLTSKVKVHIMKLYCFCIFPDPHKAERLVGLESSFFYIVSAFSGTLTVTCYLIYAVWIGVVIMLLNLVFWGLINGRQNLQVGFVGCKYVFGRFTFIVQSHLEIVTIYTFTNYLSFCWPQSPRLSRWSSFQILLKVFILWFV